MARTRTRSTPYPAQLDRHLSELAGRHVSFSAASLADVFEHPPSHQRRLTTSVSGIAKALRRAFAEEKIIAFRDEGGAPLREEAFCAPGSAAVEHPEIYATSGTSSPREGYLPVTYRESLHASHEFEEELDGDSPHGEKRAEPPMAPTGESADGIDDDADEPERELEDGRDDSEAVDDALQRLA